MDNLVGQFIPCDVISLVLQATGGGMASVASHNGDDVTTGDNIMIAGLSFQVVTLLVFMLCSADFAINTMRRQRQLGSSALDQGAEARKLRNSFMFKGFLAALALATICIFWRSVYRVAELSKGWEGPLMYRQDLFIGFEGVMIAVASLVLNVFHPSICFREMMDGQGGIGSKKKSQAAPEKSGTSSPTGERKSEPVSDAEGGGL
jgi:hypothetical protein